MKTLLSLLLLLISFNSQANIAANQINEILKESSAQSKPEKPHSLKVLEDYYFIYVFKSTCPHCHKFTPVIHDFVKTYQLELHSYSIDGGTIAGLKSSPMPADLFDTLFINAGYKPVVPALFLVNAQTNQVYAVLFGESTPVGLVSRLSELLEKIKEQYDA